MTNDIPSKVVLGDCLDELPKIESNSVDLILTDPPYLTTDYSFDGVDLDFSFIFKQFKRILKINGWFFLFGTLSMFSKALENEWRHKFEYIWIKPSTIPITHNTVRPLTQHEIIAVFIKPELEKMNDLYFDRKLLETRGKSYKRQHNESDVVGDLTKYNRRVPLTKDGKKYDFLYENNGKRSPSTILYYPNKNRMPFKERLDHPTQKPEKLIELIVNAYCPKNGVVLDPFCGSGTTAIACMKAGRNYICIEKEPEYFEMAQNRINEYKPQTKLVLTP